MGFSEYPYPMPVIFIKVPGLNIGTMFRDLVSCRPGSIIRVPDMGNDVMIDYRLLVDAEMACEEYDAF